MNTALVQRLANLRGIGDAYHDYRGELQYFSLQTKAGILRAMGCAVDDDAALAAEIRQLEGARARKFLPALVTAHGPRAGFEINITAREFGATLVWTLKLENGERRGGAISSADCREVWRGDSDGTWITRRHFDVPVDLPPGYHELELKIGSGSVARCPLISSPARCFEPPRIIAGERLWGVAVQLYTLRSDENWGIGDFSDLQSLIRWVAPHGAAFIGLNPLHAMSPAEPSRSSPYSASSRHFLNVLYIAVPAVPEFGECVAAHERLQQPQIREDLARLRECPLVEYEGVARLKFEILELLHRDFRERHLRALSERGRSFLDFLAAGGEPLQMHARFDALDRHFMQTRGGAAGWLNWPAEYRDVNGTAATQFGPNMRPKWSFSRTYSGWRTSNWRAHKRSAWHSACRSACTATTQWARIRRDRRPGRTRRVIAWAPRSERRRIRSRSRARVGEFHRRIPPPCCPIGCRGSFA